LNKTGKGTMFSTRANRTKEKKVRRRKKESYKKMWGGNEKFRACLGLISTLYRGLERR